MSARKTITDTIYGTVGVEGVVLDLLETLEVQRLSGIRQLGPTYLVFPGANHSRLEHVLGAGHMACRAAKALDLPEDEADLLACAALLHDVGHGPFSHTLESILDRSLGIDHMDFTQAIITGKEDNVRPEEREAMPDVPRIHEVLCDYGLDPEQVARLVRGVEAPEYDLTAPEPGGGQSHFAGHRYLPQLMHSAVDVDQLDYLQRDAHYTGVVHGKIDFDRLVETMAVHNGQLVFERKGVSAVEGVLVARALMYSAVYFHKTVRIAELMMARAVERSDGAILDVQRMVDSELMTWLTERGGLPREMALRLKYRKLYKRAYLAGEEDLSLDRMDALRALGTPSRDPRHGSPDGRPLRPRPRRHDRPTVPSLQPPSPGLEHPGDLRLGGPRERPPRPPRGRRGRRGEGLVPLRSHGRARRTNYIASSLYPSRFWDGSTQRMEVT